jgi:hypothetical protein
MLTNQLLFPLSSCHPIPQKPRLGFQPAVEVLAMSIRKDKKLQIGFAGQKTKQRLIKNGKYNLSCIIYVGTLHKMIKYSI